MCNLFTWNAIIVGYAQIGDHGTAFDLLYCLERKGLDLDEATFAIFLSLLDDPELYKLAM